MARVRGESNQIVRLYALVFLPKPCVLVSINEVEAPAAVLFWTTIIALMKRFTAWLEQKMVPLRATHVLVVGG